MEINRLTTETHKRREKRRKSEKNQKAAKAKAAQTSRVTETAKRNLKREGNQAATGSRRSSLKEPHFTIASKWMLIALRKAKKARFFLPRRMGGSRW